MKNSNLTRFLTFVRNDSGMDERNDEGGFTGI